MLLSPISRVNIVCSFAALSGTLAGQMPKRPRRAQLGISNLGHWAKKRKVSNLEVEEKENVSILTALYNTALTGGVRLPLVA